MALSAGTFAFQSKRNKQYLRYVSEKDKARFRFVEFSEDDVWSPNVKFQVEKANSGDGKYVHIRSSYNNKYLRRLDDSQQYWIVAGADGKEEDTSQWSCTLFEPIAVRNPIGVDFGYNNYTIQLRHVQLGNYTQVYTSSGDFQGCMIANSATPGADENLDADVYTFTDWASLVVLPKYVAFKGHDGNYLCSTPGEDSLVQFVSSDIGVEGVAHQIFPSNDGSVRIRPYGNEVRTWMVDYVLSLTTACPVIAGSGSGTEGQDYYMSLFQPVQVGDNGIALKMMYTNPPKFCGRSNEDFLVIDSTTITEREKLTLVEPVMNRTISLTFRLDDARVYDMTPVSMDTVEHDNTDTDTVSKSVTLKYQKEMTTSWQNSSTWKLGVKTSFSVEAVPFVAKASVELNAEYGGTYTMGETKTESEEIIETGVYLLRGRHKLIVEKLATKGHCDVPFSYTQTDQLFTGERVTTVLSDGLYKGVNCFHFYTVSKQVPLPPTSV